MPKQNLFITDSDLPTLKNDGTADVSVTVPASYTVPGNGITYFSADVSIGSALAITGVRIASSAEGNVWYRAQTKVMVRGAINSGTGTTIDVCAFVWRVSPTVLRCQIEIPNPYATVTTGAPFTDIISFHINSYVPPFA
jgi:hypothetical protein